MVIQQRTAAKGKSGERNGQVSAGPLFPSTYREVHILQHPFVDKPSHKICKALAVTSNTSLIRLTANTAD